MPQNGAMACLYNAMLIPYLAILAAGGSAAAPDAIQRPPAFKVEVPGIVLTDVPVSFVRITKLNPDGTVDRSFNRQVFIRGIRLSVPKDVDNTNRILTADVREDAELPAFRGGVLELKTNLSKRRKVFIVGSVIVVDPESRQPTSQPILRTQRWFSIVPPLLAILLAVWLRNVIVALFVGGARRWAAVAMFALVIVINVWRIWPYSALAEPQLALAGEATAAAAPARWLAPRRGLRRGGLEFRRSL